jgi:glycosyltransferase involved in cell wall biosynthesis
VDYTPGMASQPPVVTVVIPTRNRFSLLKEAVASVEAQHDISWELVIVDDASDDGSAICAAELAGGTIRVVGLERHSERSHCRNVGLAEAHAEFVVFLDDDDRLLPGALRKLARTLSRYPRTAAAVGARIDFSQDGHRRRARHPRLVRWFIDWRHVVVGWGALPGQCMFRTSVVRGAGGWDERLLSVEEHELQLRLAGSSSLVLVPYAVLEYRVHSGQWRPIDVAIIEEQIRLEFISKLSGAARWQGERLVAARKEWRRADSHFALAEYGPALAGYVRALKLAPGLILLSGATNTALVSQMTKATAGVILGRRASGLARRLLKLARHLRLRDPGARSATAVVRRSARR